MYSFEAFIWDFIVLVYKGNQWIESYHWASVLYKGLNPSCCWFEFFNLFYEHAFVEDEFTVGAVLVHLDLQQNLT